MELIEGLQSFKDQDKSLSGVLLTLVPRLKICTSRMFLLFSIYIVM